ncbi:MAG TPA: aryl-sulfate sulfotransferase [Candidatus Acidoferrales bacterium]
MSANRIAVAFLAVILFAVLSGCGGSSSSSGGVTPETATVSPTTADLIGGQTQQFTTNINTNPNKLIWSVNGTPGGDSTDGTIDTNGNYTAPSAQPTAAVTITVASTSNSQLTASAMVTVIATGTVAAAPANKQVAIYTIAPPGVTTVAIQFGLDTTYGLTTSQQVSAGAAAPLATFVAGMKGNTEYHMRAVLMLPDGTTLNDVDHTFTTVGLPAAMTPQITVANPNNLTPQPGVEMLDLIEQGTLPGVTVSDLQGNVIWYYKTGGTNNNLVQPVKMLPNGHFLLVISPNSTEPPAAVPAGTLNVIREIDLGGNTIRELSMTTLNTRLAAAGFTYVGQYFHHDIAVLPNGHLVVLVNRVMQETDITGHPGVSNIIGDGLVDLDANLNPVWVWDAFDHLDVNREPEMYPDWTHANAVLYSATDGNLIVSMRHQNWLIKIDYNNGAGTGDVIWHLGYQGDFTLSGGTDPIDWFSGQHGPSFVTSTTAGSFGLTLFDNGDFRQLGTGKTCQNAGLTPCPYSTIQTMTVDETAKTATLTFLDNPGVYSLFGGNAQTLANGNVEYDQCNVPTTPVSAMVSEVTPTNPAQTVWQLSVPTANMYRAFRMPSLYPGVQW